MAESHPPPPYWAISRPHLYLLMKLSLLALFFVWNEEQRHDTYRSQLARSDHRYYIVSMLWSVCVYNCLTRPRGLHELTAPLCSGDSSLWSAVPLSWSLDGECGHAASSSPWAGRERWVTHVSIHIERLTILNKKIVTLYKTHPQTCRLPTTIDIYATTIDTGNIPS